MRKASILIGMCLILALALNVWAYQRTHPEIMQAVVQTRNAVNENADGGNAAATAEAGMQLQGLFQELVPIYDRMNLGGGTASQLAKEAAAHANTVVMKAKANDLAAAKAAAGEINCGGCHGQFREKTDAGFQIKTGG